MTNEQLLDRLGIFPPSDWPQKVRNKLIQIKKAAYTCTRPKCGRKFKADKIIIYDEKYVYLVYLSDFRSRIIERTMPDELGDNIYIESDFLKRPRGGCSGFTRHLARVYKI